MRPENVTLHLPGAKVSGEALVESKEKWWRARERAGSSSAPTHSVVHETLVIEGDLLGRGSLAIHGQVFGNVRVEDLYLAPGAYLEGEVDATRFRIAGTFVGRSDADIVLVESSAEVDGTLHHHEMVVESGAQVRGLRPWRPNKKTPGGQG